MTRTRTRNGIKLSRRATKYIRGAPDPLADAMEYELSAYKGKYLGSIMRIRRSAIAADEMLRSAIESPSRYDGNEQHVSKDRVRPAIMNLLSQISNVARGVYFPKENFLELREMLSNELEKEKFDNMMTDYHEQFLRDSKDRIEDAVVGLVMEFDAMSYGFGDYPNVDEFINGRGSQVPVSGLRAFQSEFVIPLLMETERLADIIEDEIENLKDHHEELVMHWLQINGLKRTKFHQVEAGMSVSSALRSVIASATKMKAEIEQSSVANAESVADKYIARIEGAVNKLDAEHDAVEMASMIRAQIEDARSITGRSQYGDIRDWTMKSSRRYDLIDIAQKIKRIASKYQDGVVGTKSTPYHGVPNYVYKVGSRVRVHDAEHEQYGESGKVIGVSKMNGTGRQSYRVRLDNYDQPQDFRTVQLRKE